MTRMSFICYSFLYNAAEPWDRAVYAVLSTAKIVYNLKYLSKIYMGDATTLREKFTSSQFYPSAQQRWTDPILLHCKVTQIIFLRKLREALWRPAERGSRRCSDDSNPKWTQLMLLPKLLFMITHLNPF